MSNLLQKRCLLTSLQVLEVFLQVFLFELVQLLSNYKETMSHDFHIDDLRSSNIAGIIAFTK